MGSYGKWKINITQQRNLVAAYKLRNHIGRLIQNKITVGHVTGFKNSYKIKRMGLSSFFQRQRKRKGRAFAFFAFEINTTSVSFDNFFTDIKPQSQAGKSIFAHPEKAAKYFWLIGYRNSYPKIPHRKNDVFSRFF